MCYCTQLLGHRRKSTGVDHSMMDLVIGGLDMNVSKDSQLGLHIMTKMYFAHISYLSGIGGFMMALIGLLQEMILA